MSVFCLAQGVFALSSGGIYVCVRSECLLVSQHLSVQCVCLRGEGWVSSSASSHRSRQGLSLNLSLTVMDSLASLNAPAPGVPCLCLQSWDYRMATTLSWLFCGFWGSTVWPPCLCSECSTHQDISPAPYLFWALFSKSSMCFRPPACFVSLHSCVCLRVCSGSASQSADPQTVE